MLKELRCLQRRSSRLKHLCLPWQRPFATLRVAVCRVSFHQKCAALKTAPAVGLLRMTAGFLG